MPIEVPNEVNWHIMKKLVKRRQAIYCQYGDNFVTITSTNNICQFYHDVYKFFRFPQDLW